MSTEIHNINKIPDGVSYSSSDLSEFEEYDLKNVYSENIDEIWYWYTTGSYEGSGQILMRKGDLYDTHDCGHCSCYGPCDRIKFKGKTKEQLLSSFSEEYKRDCLDLLKKARLID